MGLDALRSTRLPTEMADTAAPPPELYREWEVTRASAIVAVVQPPRHDAWWYYCAATRNHGRIPYVGKHPTMLLSLNQFVHETAFQVPCVSQAQVSFEIGSQCQSFDEWIAEGWREISDS
jgi:hypothetical protein